MNRFAAPPLQWTSTSLSARYPAERIRTNRARSWTAADQGLEKRLLLRTVLRLRAKVPFNESMVCEWYGAGSFIASADDVEAPAIECAECQALTLEAASSEQEGAGRVAAFLHVGHLSCAADRGEAWPTLIPRGFGRPIAG